MCKCDTYYIIKIIQHSRIRDYFLLDAHFYIRCPISLSCRLRICGKPIINCLTLVNWSHAPSGPYEVHLNNIRSYIVFCPVPPTIHTYKFQRFAIAFFFSMLEVVGIWRFICAQNDTHTRVDWHQFDTMAISHYSFLYKIAARLINWRPFRLGSAYVLRLTGYAWNWYI